MNQNQGQKYVVLGILSAVATFAIGVYIGGIVKKKKLIGNHSEDIMLYRKDIDGFYHRTTPENASLN